VSEQARARSLLDLLSAARARPKPEELRRLDTLSRRINDRHREMLLDAGSRGIAEDDLEAELTGLLERRRQAEAAVAGPHLRALPAPPILSLEEVRTGLFDDETLFLEYFLGEDRSFLWAVTTTTTRFVSTLPGRETVEQAARRASQRMAESHLQTSAVASRQAAAQLSRMILGPVADLLGRRRLVVVAPGALQAVPFAALPGPDPGAAEERPLIVDHEIVTLPSASVLGALRRRIAERKPPSGLLAVVADPVLDPGDGRLRGRLRSVPVPAGGAPLSRLPYSAREAAAILSLAGTEPVLAAAGFAANRELVQGGRLRDFRILHFATHSLWNDRHPELSSLVLSAFDDQGRPVDGQLRAYEVSSLDLRADLVVLSACRTALGREVGGEGLIGMTQGFLHAGAPRLIVSLWDVDDRATSELMQRFYSALLRDGLPPAAALRQAQISLWKEERWRAPYHWAGFLFQGEWN
jgi:CHAT domain-containing protein